MRTALHEQSALLQATLENMDQGLIMFDADQRIRVYNKRALELLDLPEQLMEQRPTLRRLIEHQLASNDFARSTEAFRQWVIDSGVRVARDVYERVRPDGSVLEIRTVPLAGGGAVRTYTDITARREAEREQHASEERYRAVIATGAAILWRAAPNGEITHEDGWRSYTGQSSAEALGRGWLERVHPADRTWVLDRWMSIVASRAPGALEYRVVRADGTVRWVQARAVPLIDAEHEIREWVGTLTDIDEQRTAQETLAESEARYRLLTESLTDMIVRADQTGLRLYVSPASREILGYEPEELVGTRASQFTHPDDLQALQMKLAAIGRGEIERTTMNYRLRHKSGHWVPIEASFRVVRSPTGLPEGIISVSRDISARRRLEAQFQQAQKMEAMGQLTGGIAHDFNNLLTVVMGNLDMLRRAKPERAPRLIENALAAVEQGRRLTGQLLAFSRRQPLKPEVVEVGPLLARMDGMLAQSLRGDIVLEIDVAEGLWPVEVDPTQLQSALINLAANARDAMPRGGTFRIRAQNRVALDGTEAEGVAIQVSDTGQGIAPEHLPRVFEPFFTTKETGKGTGLGLAQVYGFVQQSAGTVDIMSEPGRGTTLTLMLPRATRPAASSQPMAPVARDTAARAHRILLVEDNEQVADLAAALLQEAGHRVERAATARAALDALLADASFDLVFSDLVMPGGMDGLELARTVRRRWPTLPVLLATGYSSEASQAQREGFRLLAKPYEPSVLLGTVSEMASPREPGSNVIPLRSQ